MGASQSTSTPSDTPNLEGIESIKFYTNASYGCVRTIERFLKLADKLAKTEKVEVDIFVYSINDWTLVCNPTNKTGFLKSLISNRNAHVRIVTDGKQSEEKNSKNTLECLKNGSNPSNLELYPFSQLGGGSMHTKTAIFKIGGQRHLVMGSYNWTSAARDKNIENCIVITDNGNNEVINMAQAQFDRLWREKKSQRTLLSSFTSATSQGPTQYSFSRASSPLPSNVTTTTRTVAQRVSSPDGTPLPLKDNPQEDSSQHPSPPSSLSPTWSVTSSQLNRLVEDELKGFKPIDRAGKT